jgi:hypothetical protein
MHTAHHHTPAQRQTTTPAAPNQSNT